MTTFSSRSTAYVATTTETQYGVTQSTPELTYLTVDDCTLSLAIDTKADDTIHADGQQRYVSTGNKHISGDIDAPFLWQQQEGLIGSALQSSMQSKVMKIGTTPSSLTVERGIVSSGQYHVFRGITVDKMTMTCGINGDATMKYSCIGQSLTVGTATIDTTNPITSPTVRAPLKSQGGVLKEGGTVIAYGQSITMTTDRGLSELFGFGGDTNFALASMGIKVTGSVTVWFVDDIMYAKFRNGTASSLEWTLTDGTNTYNVKLPNLIYTQAPTSLGTGSAIPITFSFTALYDGTSASVLTLTSS